MKHETDILIQELRRQNPAACQEAVAETAAPAPTLSIIIEECPPVVAKTVKTGKKTQRREIPDTLGNSIWQHRENVVRAIQVLADCEATIVREEQEVRNDIVKATYNAMPQPANVILVSDENGDYEVIERRAIIGI